MPHPAHLLAFNQRFLLLSNIMLLAHFCYIFLKTVGWETMYFCQPCKYFKELLLFCLIGMLWLLKKPPDKFTNFKILFFNSASAKLSLDGSFALLSAFSLLFDSLNPALIGQNKMPTSRGRYASNSKHW